MRETIVHHEGAAALAAAGHQHGNSAATIKLGLDIHAQLYVVAAQYDHALPKPPRRFAPEEFVPWVESLRREGHTVLDEAARAGVAHWQFELALRDGVPAPAWVEVPVRFRP